MKKFLAAMAIVAFSVPAFGADMPTATPRNKLFTNAFPYNGNGFYWGLGAEGEAADVTLATPNATTGKIVALGGSADIIMGYTWGYQNKFVALEGRVGYTNLGVQTACDPAIVSCQFNATWNFEQRVKLGGPVDAMLSFLPNLSTVLPTLPVLQGSSVGTHPYAFVSLRESDVSAAFGLATAHKWRVEGGIGVGVIQQIKQDMAMDVWVKWTPAQSSFNVGPGTSVDNGKKITTGMAILF